LIDKLVDRRYAEYIIFRRPLCVIGVPAAQTLMKGTSDVLANGTIAMETGVSIPPKNATTFSF